MIHVVIDEDVRFDLQMLAIDVHRTLAKIPASQRLAALALLISDLAVQINVDELAYREMSRSLGVQVPDEAIMC